MALSSTRKQCANDDGCKQAAVTNCEGCSKAFCVKHFSDHRRLLDEEMNVIINEHDYLKNTLNQQTIKRNQHPLIEDVNNWEKESIVKIQQRAASLREQFLQSITAHEGYLLKELQHLSEKLKESREHNDFIETDLQGWKKTMDDLKTALVSLSTTVINRHDNSLLVQNILNHSPNITNELFKQVSDARVRFEENSQVAVCDSSNDYTLICGRTEYRSGRHKIRLCIEQLNATWIFFGMNSKLTPFQIRSRSSESVYGWTSDNSIYVDGKYAKNQLTSPIELKTNNVISLLFDCNNCKISLINESTLAKHKLSVNMTHCPFPWQLCVVLFDPNRRVHIL